MSNMSFISLLGVTLLTASVAGAFLLAIKRRARLTGRATSVIAGALMLLIAVGTAAGPGSLSLPWVSSVGLKFQLEADGMGLLFAVLIGVVGAAVFAFTGAYFGGKPGHVRFSAVMLVFALAMIGIVISDDVFTLFVFWELTTFASYLLIGHHYGIGAARRAARQAVLTTGAGGLAVLAGLIILAIESGTSSLGGLVEASPASPIGWILVLVGAMTKSAQFPFQGWLPAAMVAPTPASAFLHSATMVKAGIILLGRLGPAASQVEWWAPAVVTIGLVTLVIGGYRALMQSDLKLLLAHGTVSQLGLMFALIGSGIPDLAAAGLAVLIAHALYKSALFLVVGVIDSAKKTREISRLGGLWAERPVLTGVGVVAAASMASFPFTAGFVSKEAVLETLLQISPSLAVVVAAASVLTVAYATRFAFGAFGGPSRARVREPLALLAGPAALTGLAFFVGLMPSLIGSPVADATSAAFGFPIGPPKLVVWPGLVPALLLSLGGLVVGGVIGFSSVRSRQLEGSTVRPHSFDRWVDRLQVGAERLTGILQNGSLPVYLGQILMVAVVLPFPALVRLDLIPSPLDGGSFNEWVVVVLMVIIAGALLNVRRRMVAVLLLGALGYGMSALFAMAGAPDVALTQLLVETLIVAMFALALRILPLQFATRSSFSIWKATVAGAAGIFAVAVTLVIGSVPATGTVSEQMLQRSVPDASGANVVNVALVDFRAADTLGEILVLGIAALGVLALVRPFGDRVRSDVFISRISPILRRGVGVIGPLLLVFSVYLLFAGHNQPGGGFAAGLVASAWLVLRWLAGGRESSADIGPHPAFMIGLGLALAVLVGLGGFIWSGSFLASRAWELDVAVLGDLKVVTALAFDAGVAVLVFGAVTSAIRGLEGS